jgi:hypothetical protein
MVLVDVISYSVVLKPTRMLFELSMVVEMQVSQWLIENELVFFTGVNSWINTQKSRLSQSCQKKEDIVLWKEKCHFFGRSRCSICSNLMLVVFLRVVDEAGLQELEKWLDFWHFHVKQWKGFLIHVMFSTLPHISSFTPYFWQFHIYSKRHFKIT